MSRIHQGILPVVLANRSYVPYIANLFYALELKNIPWRPAVAVTDSQAAHELQKHNIKSLLFSCAAQTETAAPWLSEDFKNITFAKLDLLLCCQRALPNTHLLYIDGDIAFYQDPWPYLLRCLEDHPQNLCFGQCDEGPTSFLDAHAGCPNLCTGFFLIRAPWPKRVPVILNHRWYRRRPLLEYDCDQHFLNDAIRKHRIPSLAFDRSLVPNGVFLRKEIPAPALLLHYNYLIGTEKEQAMRARGDWLERTPAANQP